MAQKIQIDVGDDQSITALYSRPESRSIDRIDDTLIIMSHGFPGHKAAHDDLYGGIEEFLTRKKYHSLRFDFRGCGESDGKEENFTIANAKEDFQTILHWAKSHKYERFIYIGEGLGATISILKNDLDVAAFILFWPVLDTDFYRKNAFGISFIEEKELDKGYVEHDSKRLGIPFLKELRTMKALPSIQDVRQPTLIMHGAKDVDIPISQLEIARKHMNAKRIEITSYYDGETGLLKPNHRKSMLFQTQQFIEKYI